MDWESADDTSQTGRAGCYSPPSLHDHVGGDFENDVEGEKDSEAGLVLRCGEFEVDRKTKQVGVTVGSVVSRNANSKN